MKRLLQLLLASMLGFFATNALAQEKSAGEESDMQFPQSAENVDNFEVYQELSDEVYYLKIPFKHKVEYYIYDEDMNRVDRGKIKGKIEENIIPTEDLAPGTYKLKLYDRRGREIPKSFEMNIGQPSMEEEFPSMEEEMQQMDQQENQWNNPSNQETPDYQQQETPDYQQQETPDYQQQQNAPDGGSSPNYENESTPQANPEDK